MNLLDTFGILDSIGILSFFSLSILQKLCLKMCPSLGKRLNLLLPHWWKFHPNIKHQWSLICWGNVLFTSLFILYAYSAWEYVGVIISFAIHLFSGRKGNAPERFALPPPVYSAASDRSLNSPPASSFQQSPSSYYNQHSAAEAAPSAPSIMYENQVHGVHLYVYRLLLLF